MIKNLIFDQTHLKNRIRNGIGDEYNKINERILEKALDYTIEQLDEEVNKEKFYDLLTKAGLDIATKKYNSLTKDELKSTEELCRENLNRATKKYHESLPTPIPYTTQFPGCVRPPLGM